MIVPIDMLNSRLKIAITPKKQGYPYKCTLICIFITATTPSITKSVIPVFIITAVKVLLGVIISTHLIIIILKIIIHDLLLVLLLFGVRNGPLSILILVALWVACTLPTSSGAALHSSATAPATCGAAIDVPSM